jgi:uncharacterized RDD family membrane protein YckC
MDWFYAQNGQQLGPVSESYLGQLSRSGTISPDTLVWHAGMTQWQPFRTASTTFQTPLRMCNSCGLQFPAGDLAIFGASAICLTCQPAYVQRLRQGMSYTGTPQLQYAGFWIRFLAMFIDSIIIDIVQYIVLIPLGLASVDLSTANSDQQTGALFEALLIVVALNLCYYVVFWSRYGATPGKMALGLKVVRPDGTAISVGQALGRYFSYGLSGLILGIGFLMAGWDDQKRSLHDRICETRVIRTR